MTGLPRARRDATAAAGEGPTGSGADLFTAIRYAGAAYLLVMAWKLWSAPVRSVLPDGDGPREREGRLFMAGLALTLGNPKVIVFFLAILPTVVSLDKLSPIDVAEVAGLIVLILSGVMTAYVSAAARARRLFTSPTSLRRLNRGTGIAMAGAAVAVAVR